MFIPRKEYRAHPAINASYLKQVYAHSYWKAEVPTTVTPAMQMGTLAHTLILEPKAFEEEYAVFDGDRRTKAGKEAYAALEASGKLVVGRKELDNAMAMGQAVAAQRGCTELLEGAVAVEQSMLFQWGKFEAKAQIDLFAKGGVLVDLKTIGDISKAERQFFNMHYDLQLAWYKEACNQNGLTVKAVKVMFVESAAPYRVALFDLSDDVLELGQAKAAEALKKWQHQKAMPVAELITGRLDIPDWMAISSGETGPF